MKLYLVQHGEALAKEVDPARPLSERGRREVERVARALGDAGLRVARVVHSGKTRAEQTAAILAAVLCPGGECEARDGIDPTDPTDALAYEAEAWDEDVMVVGHLPFMARLASRLAAGDEEAGAVAFRPGSVVCFERGEGNGWAIAWMLRPELLA